MSPLNLSFLFLISLTLVSTTTSQERAPHGLVYENPIAFPPSAYLFFHPNAPTPDTKNSCITSKCSPLPMAAALVEANQKFENKASQKQIGAGVVGGIIFAFAFVVVLVVGVYYVKVIRQANMSRNINNVQSHA
ncbi:unnamed protein product [Lathyrus oleraceus]|uniref:uncharacterized protein LOC127101156 n=1 Tax=Pisum sativum TaxID=3888 RepID=UPI0021D23E85|nr:uncharacterized protein LOC127101156 [Pisum sativum]